MVKLSAATDQRFQLQDTARHSRTYGGRSMEMSFCRTQGNYAQHKQLVGSNVRYINIKLAVCHTSGISCILEPDFARFRGSEGLQQHPQGCPENVKCNANGRKFAIAQSFECQLPHRLSRLGVKECHLPSRVHDFVAHE